MVVVAYCSILLSCSLFEKKLKIEIPDARWPPIFFKSIDTVTEFGSLKRLRETHLAEGDMEIRVWRGFSTARLEGVILSKTTGAVSARYIISDDCCNIRAAYLKTLPPPKSGWEVFWGKIDEAGITTLPDSSVVNCETPGIDGISYVVEINRDNVYRTYMYETSYPQKCEEVQKMKQIGRTIAEEFYDGKQECKNAEWLPCVAKFGVINDL